VELAQGYKQCDERNKRALLKRCATTPSRAPDTMRTAPRPFVQSVIANQRYRWCGVSIKCPPALSSCFSCFIPRLTHQNDYPDLYSAEEWKVIVFFLKRNLE